MKADCISASLHMFTNSKLNGICCLFIVTVVYTGNCMADATQKFYSLIKTFI